MNNDVMTLNNALFESIERLQDDSLDSDSLEKEIKRADAAAKTAEVIISNAELVLKTQKHLDEYGKPTHLKNPLLGGDDVCTSGRRKSWQGLKSFIRITHEKSARPLWGLRWVRLLEPSKTIT